MAAPKKTALPADPVNSEQLEMAEQEADSAAPLAAPGPTTGELEERAAEAEERAEKAERDAASLREEMEELKRTVSQLMRGAKPASSDARPVRATFELDEADRPVLDLDRPYGTIIGDTMLAFEQDGHQFGHDREYVQSMPVKLRGSGRPFNPRLVGVVMPRAGQARIDGLEGIRGRE